jgi:SAM-dependent methyltransferase
MANRPSLLRRFLDANRRLSERFDPRLDAALYRRYDADVADCLASLPSGAIVVDVGGGRHCSFADELHPDRAYRVIAVDISPEELGQNSSVDETRVGDVAVRLPFEDAEVDLVVSRTVLEHVVSVDAAAREMARILRPGGRSVHLLPCRYALFAIAARVLPFSLAKRLVHKLLPESEGIVEFDVFYDKGHPVALQESFRAAGFTQVDVTCTWDQSGYFHPVFPLFLLILAYQRIVTMLRLRVVASYAMIQAVR